MPVELRPWASIEGHMIHPALVLLSAVLFWLAITGWCALELEMRA